MRSSKPNSAYPRNGCNTADECRQISVASFSATALIIIDVLSEQRHFSNALRGKGCDFNQDIIEWTADFFAPGIGHHTKTAIFAAAFHDGDKCGRAFCTGLRQTVKFFDFGKTDINQ